MKLSYTLPVLVIVIENIADCPVRYLHAVRCIKIDSMDNIHLC